MPRPRKTITELKAAGTFRPSRHGAREKAEAGAVPVVATAAPSGLPPDVRAERDRLAALLGERVSAADGAMLDELAFRLLETSRLREAQRAAAPGSVEHSRVSRALTAERAALDRLAHAFGLTPGARTSLPEVEPSNGALTW